ncbi:hypothetical protein [Corynebacterium casei]|uniref:hypothetical protein n=1 Tax=Corynebacterium casei TaxID=160386 RepID=UPI003FD03082
MSIREVFQTVCKDADIELPAEFDDLATERNGRIDVITNGTAELPLQEHKKQYLALLKPLREYGWQVNFGGNRVMVAPPKDDTAEDTKTPKPQRLGGLKEVTGLLDHPAMAWQQAVIRNNKVVVPNVGSAHHIQILAKNMADLQRLGYRVVKEANFRGEIKFYEVNPPMSSPKADTVADAMQQALGLNDIHARWVKLGRERARSITFNRADNEHGYNQARAVSSELNRSGWLIETVEGASETITFTAPKNALN